MEAFHAKSDSLLCCQIHQQRISQKREWFCLEHMWARVTYCSPECQRTVWQKSPVFILFTIKLTVFWYFQKHCHIVVVIPCQQGLKKCKFPGKLVKISHGPQVKDDRPLIMSQKEFVFLKTLHSRVLTITVFT